MRDLYKHFSDGVYFGVNGWATFVNKLKLFHLRIQGPLVLKTCEHWMNRAKEVTNMHAAFGDSA